ncbi:MAG TPA: hypothetical protein VNI54_02855 [Thermoanaerobaculia bacterium]|nr:hypothetical protein [Thermoanaerobaculia bacterium]
MSFALPPDPLTRRQRAIVATLALFCAATRFLAMARSLWDWDEALFTMAMADYDVTMHHPHPPGFPAYIAMAKVMRLVIGDDFRALQSVNLIAAVLVFPAMFLFARELRLRFSTAASAAAVFAFFPNVWFFGGGAFSDVPSIVLVLFAVAFLLRGIRDRNSYFLGTLLLAVAIGIRPQNLLVGLVPGILATRKRRWWEILVALLIGVTVVGIAFGGAIHATGSLKEYTRMVREHGDYISRVDSFRAEARPPLWRIFDRFFIKQYQSPILSIIASIFVVISIVGAIRERSRPLLLNTLTFGAFAIFAWLMLDRFSISRFSIGYQPMFAVFVADGIARVGRRREWMLSTAIVAAFIVYTFPALTPVRNEVAPSIVAASTAAQRIDPRREQLFVGHTMLVFMDLLAPDFPYTRVVDDRALPMEQKDQSWLLAEITTTRDEGLVFRRQRGALWNIARRHYFDIKLAPLHDRAQFVSGWYPPESEESHQWRWMSGRSVTMLPPGKGEMLLRLHLGIPGELVEQRPEITIRVNGQRLDTIIATHDSIERDYHVVRPAPEGQPNTLELSIDRTVPSGEPPRDVGLRLRYLAWGPA